MRRWQRDMLIAHAQLTERYCLRLIQVERISATLAREHAENVSLETMKIYLGEK
jgi:hypothetical protein